MMIEVIQKANNTVLCERNRFRR